jgi:hypothetical protein
MDKCCGLFGNSISRNNPLTNILIHKAVHSGFKGLREKGREGVKLEDKKAI